MAAAPTRAMEPASRAGSEGRVFPGGAWLRRMSPLRRGRYVLAAFAALFAMLCLTRTHNAMPLTMVPETLPWTVRGWPHMSPTISTAGKADGLPAALSVSARRTQAPAEPLKQRLHSISAPALADPGISAAPAVMVQSGAAGAVRLSSDDPAQAALGRPPDRVQVAPATAVSSSEAADAQAQQAPQSAVSPGDTDTTAWNGRQLLPIAGDADSTGAGRTPEEARRDDAEGCAVVQARGRTAHLRLRHSRDAVGPLIATGGGLDADTPDSEIDPLTYKFPFHVPENPGARTYADMRWCPGSLEPPPEQVTPIDPRYRTLFVIGAQKAGTTWLHHALSLHKEAVFGVPKIGSGRKCATAACVTVLAAPAQTRIIAGAPVHHDKPHWKKRRRKELQFFNTWPARSTEEFLSMWPPRELRAMRDGTSRKFLFDGSPEYLLNAAVAPRLKQMVPHAKIVIVLRDPTARAFSAWTMKAGWGEFCDNQDLSVSRMCVERSFEETFNAWHNSFARPECRFTSPGSNASWGDCFGCRYNLFQLQRCCAVREEHGDALFPCFGVPRGFSVLDYSSYAAQIAWWLQFFPPEQIYIVTSETLHDKDKRVTVLNELLDFMGLQSAPRFTQREVNTAAAFNGHYGKISAADAAAQAHVRRFHAPQVRDLRVLLARFFPRVDATALDAWSHPEAA